MSSITILSLVVLLLMGIVLMLSLVDGEFSDDPALSQWLSAGDVIELKPDAQMAGFDSSRTHIFLISSVGPEKYELKMLDQDWQPVARPLIARRFSVVHRRFLKTGEISLDDPRLV